MESKPWEYESVSEGSQSAYETAECGYDRLDTFCVECQIERLNIISALKMAINDS